jgi:hypothetical protein
MCSTGKIRGHSVLESMVARGNGRCGFERRAAQQSWLPWQSEFVDLGGIERSVGDFAEIFAGMDTQQLAVGCRRDGTDFHRRPAGQQQIVRLREFHHGKRMTRRKRQEIVRVVKATKSWHAGHNAIAGLARQTI